MKKLSILLVAFLLKSCVSFSQDENHLYPFRNKSGNGFINRAGDIVIGPTKSQFGEFSEGLCTVTGGGDGLGLGYINKKGEIVIDQIYKLNKKTYSQFSEGLAVIQVDYQPDFNSSTPYKCGYIDRDGNMIIEPQYNSAKKFKDGYAVVSLPKIGQVIIDKTGEIVINPQEICIDLGFIHPREKKRRIIDYVSINNGVSEGIIPFKIHKSGGFREEIQMGALNTKGELVIPIKNFFFNEFYNGISLAISSDYKKSGYINKKGEVIIPFKFRKASRFYNGYAKVQDDKTGKYGIINEKGKYVVQPEYSSISDNFYKDDLILVKKSDKYGSGKYGYIDIKGNVVIDFKYHFAYDFSENLAMVYDRVKKKRFYINKKGEKIIELDFNTNSQPYPNFINGLARVSLINEGEVYINKLGEVIFRFRE